MVDSKLSLLVISQVYVPDPASVGQHMADAAQCLAARGHRVQVLTSARGYESPEQHYPPRETRGGVDVVRLPFSSFGKRSILHRLTGQLLFLAQVIIRGTFRRNLDGILVSTSPPMASFAAVVISFVRRVPITYWVMDLNPDQVLTLGKVSKRNPLVMAMRWLNRRIFARAAEVVVLDRFMQERIRSEYRVNGRLTVLPPWPHEEALEDVPPASNPFLAEHNPDGRFVVMYSGNHTPSSPVTTLLQAAVELRDDPRFRFFFIGNGLAKREVDETIAKDALPNVVSLQYQPLDRIKFSLSAADVQIVTLGERMVGIIHPCKIYGAMAIGRPVILLGPAPSHASELIEQCQFGRCVNHGDMRGLIQAIEEIAGLPKSARAEMCQRGKTAVRQHFSKSKLCAAICDVVEQSTKRVAERAKLSVSKIEQLQGGK